MLKQIPIPYEMHFCRYVVMHRNTFWRFRRAGQVNIYLHLGQNGRLLIHTLRKLLKMVWMCSLVCISVVKLTYRNLAYILFLLSAPALTQLSGAFQSSSALVEPGCVQMPDSSTVHRSPITGAAISTWTNNSAQTVNVSNGTKGLILTFFIFS